MYKVIQTNPYKLILVSAIYGMLCVSVASAKDPSEEISHLNIEYVYFSINEIYPANIDHKNKTVYIWEDVKLEFKDIERSQAFVGGTMNIPEETGYIVKKTKPELFLLEDGGDAVFGYYAKGTGMFYRWKGLVLKKTGLPENIPVKIIRKKELDLEIIDIPIPNWFWDKFKRQNNE